MSYGKSRPENRFRDEAAFFIGQMEVQTRVNQSVTDGEYGIYGFYSFRGSQGVPDECFDRTEGRDAGSEDTPDGFPFGSVVAGSACTMYIDIVYGSGCQPGRGYGLTHGKERPVSVGGTSCLVVGFIGIGVTAEFAIRSFSKGFLRLKNKVSGSFSQV